MSGNSNRDRVIGEWVQKAEHDLRTAEHALTLEEDCPCDTICFLAQQCVEKYLKAVLVFHCVDFPKTHILRGLMELLPSDLALGVEMAEIVQLTRYAVEVRYPGGLKPVGRAEAEEAVATARKVREAARRHLPGEALARQ